MFFVGCQGRRTEEIVSLPGIVQASTSLRSIVDIAEAYHSAPLLVLFVLLTLMSTAAMATKFCLRCIAEMVDAIYDFKLACADSKQRYEQAARAVRAGRLRQ
jgi:hypothetical protein